MSRPATIGSTPTENRSSIMEPWPLRGRAWFEFFIAWGVLVGLGLLIGAILLGPLAGSELAVVDAELAWWWANQRTADLDVLTNVGSAFANTFNIIGALVLLMAVFVLTWRRWKEALTLGLALGLEAAVFLAVSLTVGRDRPPVEQLDASPPTASFPSGHTGAAFAFYVGLALIAFWRTRNPLARTVAVAGGIFFPVAVAVSRMYRGMHYLTDVTVGAIFGVVCLVVAAWIVERARRRTRVEQRVDHGAAARGAA